MKTNHHKFWSKVSIKSPDECWVFSAGKNKRGYGLTRFQGKGQLAHRVAWQIARGKIPEKVHILHKCDNPPCCNPDHLFAGSDADNVRDMISKGRNRKSFGDKNGTRTHPERRKIGTQNKNSKLTEDIVIKLRSEPRKLSYAKLGIIYGASGVTIYKAISGQTWKHLKTNQT